MGALWAFLFKVPWVQVVTFFNKLIDAWNKEMERRALEAAITKGKESKELEVRRNEKVIRDKLDDVTSNGGLMSDDEAFGPNRKTRRS